MSIELNVTLTAGTVTFRGGTKNSGNITATGSVVFLGDSENSGAVTGNATFNDTSSNNGTVTGNAVLNICGTHDGTVDGTTTYDSTSPKDCPNYIASDPPLKAEWVTNGRNRRLVVIPSRNWEQFQALNLPTEPLRGPWQNCPVAESCFAYPALYRPVAPFDFVMDYEAKPNYLEHPGNPE